MYSKDLIWIKENSITPENCLNMVKQFEEDERKGEGAMIGGVDLEIKKTFDLKITGLSGWEDSDNIIYEAFTQGLSEYREFTNSVQIGFDPVSERSGESIFDSGYQIQRYEAGSDPGYYHWHSDDYRGVKGIRVLTFLWYLNDVEVGGETEFIDEIKVQPKAGRLVIFPATWTYLHRGIPPVSSSKWIVTGWLYAK